LEHRVPLGQNFWTVQNVPSIGADDFDADDFDSQHELLVTILSTEAEVVAAEQRCKAALEAPQAAAAQAGDDG